jgi:hypothetical protein
MVRKIYFISRKHTKDSSFQVEKKLSL